MPNTVELDDITFIGTDGVGNDQSVFRALKYSKQFFPKAKFKHLSPDVDFVDASIEHVKINKLNYDEFNKFCLTEWYKYFNTTYMINCHGDGFVLNAHPWTDKFLNYDYIGAPWPRYNLERSSIRWPSVKEAYYASNKKYFVGNGGFSIRTNKLMKAVSSLYNDSHYGIPEDLVIAIIMRRQLEDMGFKFVDDIGIAARFSCEATFVDGYILSSDNSVGFHCGGTHPDKVKLLETV